MAQNHEHVVYSQLMDFGPRHDSEDSTIYSAESKSLLIVDKNAVYFIKKDISQKNIKKKKECIYYHNQNVEEQMDINTPTMDKLCFHVHQNEVTCASFSLGNFTCLNWMCWRYSVLPML